MPRRIVVLGSTGSIGTQALEIVRRHPDLFQIVGLAAGHDRAGVEKQAAEFRVEHIALGAHDAEQLVRSVPADVVLNGITGSIGLGPTLAALETGRRLALANKESLVVGGDLVVSRAQPGQIIPVDSEHSAIAQALRAGHRTEVRKLVITASGGPFRGRSRADVEAVTPAEALRHPNFAMGRVITTNSATLVNKGLEVIEAHLLFDVPYDAIEVVVHPQQFIHSMVEFRDGATIAQAGLPRMLVPIALALGWPDRLDEVDEPLSWHAAQRWDFEPLDDKAFPAVALARQVGEAGGAFPAVYNAANEQAVAAFHDGRLSFPSIVDTIARVVDMHEQPSELSIESLMDAEEWARREAERVIAAS